MAGAVDYNKDVPVSDVIIYGASFYEDIHMDCYICDVYWLCSYNVFVTV